MPERPLAVVPTWRWWAGVLVMVGIGGWLSLLAYAERLPGVFQIPQFDKLVHFAGAGLVAFFLDGAVRRRTLLTASGFAVPLAAAVVLVPAAIEEYLQRYATYRTSSIWDFAADVAGVAILIPLSRRLAQ